MVKEFWVDYDDAAFPVIRHRSHPNFSPEYTDLITLTAARAEIKERCRQERQHWLSVMHHQTDISGEKIIQEAKDAAKRQPSLKNLLDDEMEYLERNSDA
jgi:hypothetical protein